ncbi:hypothetical protein ZOSMA_26G01290 [Zostera marina]|uniref:PHD-type zinc finger plants domain-containing protein n=1 Tax=Zostera marina TaxID=29655 RepID=A0A0K9PEI0_ZOSMR|nr:hypothetical protein ZOSMA_26G01290 [Zostera marina]
MAMNKEGRGSTGTVCCMCGDVGFSDKLFRCVRCVFRFQHKYCGNYYEDNTSSETGGVCDWCRSEYRSCGKHKKLSTGKDPSAASRSVNRSEYCSSQKIKQAKGSDNEDGRGGEVKGKNGGPASSSGKSGARRYKLLKDVMC